MCRLHYYYRSPLLSRSLFKGDAGLDKKRLAFVPLGRVDQEKLSHLMTDDVSQFTAEAHIFVGDPTIAE
jgi:hypothetical protein